MADKARLQTKPATPKPTISLSQPSILQRTCACGGVPGLTGECETCSRQRLSRSPGATTPSTLADRSSNEHSTAQSQRSPLAGYSFGKLAIAPKERFGVQAKLAIGQPGNRYEQEADRVADQVMRMPNPGINTDRAKAPQVHSLGPQCQDELKRQPITITPVNVNAVATEVEDLVDNQQKHRKALEKLNPLDMRDLLAVVAKLHEDATAKNSADYGDLMQMLSTNQQTQSLNVPRLRAAFDAAPTRTLRNPAPDVRATNPTVSGYRKRPGTSTARPGDWGDDPAGNTWIAHPEGIRTYFGTSTPKDRRSSAWLADNLGNADYNKAITKRAIGSFRWGRGMHDFAIYFSETDASADLRERVATFERGRMIDYIRAHDATNPTGYLKNMQKAVPELKGDAPTTMWTTDSKKWDRLIEGFKSAEGWVVGSTITAANVGAISANPKDAAVVAYYQNLL